MPRRPVLALPLAALALTAGSPFLAPNPERDAGTYRYGVVPARTSGLQGAGPLTSSPP